MSRRIIRVESDEAFRYARSLAAYFRRRNDPRSARKAKTLALSIAVLMISEFGRTIRISKEALALAYLTCHPTWTDAKVARHIGVTRTSLYRWRRYKQARELLAQGKKDLPQQEDV